MATNEHHTVDPLDDGTYDMVDDASDISTDQPDTASLPSTTDHSDDEDGMDTPDDTGSMIDVGEEFDITDRTVAFGGSHETLPGVNRTAAANAQPSEHDEVIDSFFRDDLETPRQSTIHRFPEQTPQARASNPKEAPATAPKNVDGRPCVGFCKLVDKVLPADLGTKSLTAILTLVFLVTYLTSVWLLPALSNEMTQARVDRRRVTLSSSLTDLTGSQEVTKMFNITHLLPSPEAVDYRHPENGLVVRVATAKPKYIILSLPINNITLEYCHLDDPAVTKHGRPLAFNTSKLITGVWAFTIDPSEAYGPVHFAMKFTNRKRRPQGHHALDFTMDLGPGSYQNMTTDLTRAVGKQVIVATQRMSNLKDFVGLEVRAGISATRNVTKELAIHAGKDLQVLASAALSVFHTANENRKQVSDHLSHRIASDLETSLRTLGNNTGLISSALLSTAITTRQSAELTIRHSRKLLHDTLVFSRAHALNLKDRLTGKPQFANSTSATTELSLRLQNIFHPTGKTRRAGSLQDIVRCATHNDYAACRREQRRLASVGKDLSAMSKDIEWRKEAMSKALAGKSKEAEMDKSGTSWVAVAKMSDVAKARATQPKPEREGGGMEKCKKRGKAKKKGTPKNR